MVNRGWVPGSWHDDIAKVSAAHDAQVLASLRPTSNPRGDALVKELEEKKDE